MAHRPMRIKTRELTDPAAINRILLANHIIRIAFYDEDIGFPYIVPINYGYEYDLESGKLVFYVHCAKDGRKLDILRRNNRVAFEIDESWGLRQTESACQWGQNFNSIVGEGYISIIDDEKEVEKKRGLDIIMVKHGRFHDLNYSKESYKRTAVLKLEVERFTVKVYRDRTVPAEESGLMVQPAKNRQGVRTVQKRGFQKYVEIYQPVMRAMHAILGEYSEFILHDLSMPESSVTAVCGNVTERHIGAPTTNLVMETLRKYGDQAEDILCYPSTTKDGRQLKSMTTFIREQGKIVGCLCCNVDLTEYIMAQKLLCGFCKTRLPAEAEPKKEVFAQEISDVVEDIIHFELDNLSKPIAHMSRADKLAFVETLEAKGVFDVKGAAEMVAQHIGVSIFTVYNYIKEVRNSNKAM